MKRKFKLGFLLALIAMPQLSFSQETGWLNVVQVGGQVNSMFFVLSDTVGEPSCRGSWVIIQSGTMDAESQKRFYAALLTAMATGTKIRLAVSACNDPSHPTMISTDYWFMQNT
jgi:hypothetical protein